MASSYSNSLRLELIATGEKAGTWGDVTNVNLGTLLEQAISGYTSIAMSDANLTLTTSNGATDQARSMTINLTGALTATRNVICPSVPKIYIVKNSTIGGQSILFKTAAGSGFTIPNGIAAILFCDGTSVFEADTNKQSLNFTPVNKAGDAMTGLLTLSGAPTASLHAATKSYVDAVAGAGLTYTPVDKAGDTMTGGLTAPNYNTSGAYVAQTNSGYVFFATTGATPYGTNYDRFQIFVDPTQQRTYIGNYQGGTGSARAITLVVGATERVQINTDGTFVFMNNSGTTTAILDASGNLSVKGNVTAFAAI
jgi:hypothetical protein